MSLMPRLRGILQHGTAVVATCEVFVLGELADLEGTFASERKALL